MDENKKPTWMDIIYHRGRATYRRGYLDFSHGEGGNNHIHAFYNNGLELGYIWFDTHCDYYGFCGKTLNCCNGEFRVFLQEEFPEEWFDGDKYLFKFTEESFGYLMDYVISYLR